MGENLLYKLNSVNNMCVYTADIWWVPIHSVLQYKWNTGKQKRLSESALSINEL